MKKPRTEQPSTAPLTDVKPTIGQLVSDNASQSSRHIKIVVEDSLGDVVEFPSVSISTTMGDVIKAYCDRKELSPMQLNFIFGGTRLNANDTAETLEMDNDAVITVFEFKFGG